MINKDAKIARALKKNTIEGEMDIDSCESFAVHGMWNAASPDLTYWRSLIGEGAVQLQNSSLLPQKVIL